MARGYHSVVHQFGCLQRCSIHDAMLETHCRSCGASSRYHLNARLIDTHYRCTQRGWRLSQGPTCIYKSTPLRKQDRIAITRTFLCKKSNSNWAYRQCHFYFAKSLKSRPVSHPLCNSRKLRIHAGLWAIGALMSCRFIFLYETVLPVAPFRWLLA